MSGGPFAAALAATLMLVAPATPAAAQRGGGGGGTPRLTLSVSPASITFTAGDPDATPLVSAAPVTVQVRVQQNNAGSWQLTVLAGGDLISGADTVDISNVTWTATPAPPFQNGTVSKTVAQQVASGTGNVNPARNGSVTFRLANSWNYAAGLYSQTLVFTLSAP